jgi:hypothetical protein
LEVHKLAVLKGKVRILEVSEMEFLVHKQEVLAEEVYLQAVLALEVHKLEVLEVGAEEDKLEVLVVTVEVVEVNKLVAC